MNLTVMDGMDSSYLLGNCQSRVFLNIHGELYLLKNVPLATAPDGASTQLRSFKWAPKIAWHKYFIWKYQFSYEHRSQATLTSNF